MNYFYDDSGIRYTLASTSGGKSLNWLFIPGGPGADSSYFLSLIELYQFPGNVWLIDFPGNGSHTIWKDGFDKWLSIFVPMVKRFTNPIIVGHSFGGMIPLLYTELENILHGLVILNSSPCLWLEEAVKIAKIRNLPDLSDDMRIFTEKPNQDTFKRALSACAPYYFSPELLDQGLELLEKISFAFEPAVWWQRKAVEISYNAVWIPKQVKTVIVGAEYDAIVPFNLFESDERFSRDNIKKILIKNAGHFPWIEKPEEVVEIIKEFEAAL